MPPARGLKFGARIKPGAASPSPSPTPALKPSIPARQNLSQKGPGNSQERHHGSERLGVRPETILALLKRPEGAPLADLERATGWQPHSIRAALTGLRKRGIAITRSKDDGVTIYRAESA
ncbi:MAG: DUF3489 domain-containing protein [Proteobacteria bacterium]|nr:DUF3489 domain-containing protein [Pseudomonadota bacterium]